MVLAKVRCSHHGWQYSPRGETLWVPAVLSALAQEPGDPWGEVRQLLLLLRHSFQQILVAAQAGQGHQALPLWLCLQSFPLPILFPGVSCNCQGWRLRLDSKCAQVEAVPLGHR